MVFFVDVAVVKSKKYATRDVCVVPDLQINFMFDVGLWLIGKKSKSVFDFLTYSRKTWFSFFYAKVASLIRLIGPSNEIDRVSEFDNSLSFGAKQNALRQIFFAL